MNEKKPGDVAKKCASFYIKPETQKELKVLAKKERRSVSSYLCALIEQKVAESSVKNTQ